MIGNGFYERQCNMRVNMQSETVPVLEVIGIIEMGGALMLIEFRCHKGFDWRRHMEGVAKIMKGELVEGKTKGMSQYGK